MKNTEQIEHQIPSSPKSYRYSRAAIGLLIATGILGVVLVYSTIQNINRASLLMEQFLLDKGETIIRSIEAGNRATMAHHMGSGDPLNTLLIEYSKDSDILYIIIVDQNGSVIENVGSQRNQTLSENEIEILYASDMPVTRLDREAGVFNLSKKFKTTSIPQKMRMHSKRMNNNIDSMDGKAFISIGLKTVQFDIARKQDARHAFFMGAILFLVSTAGMYMLFLYQKMRVASTNLADIKLYTDNIIESIPVCLITIDADNQIVSGNRNTEELFGYSLSTLTGRDINEAFPISSTPIIDACKTMNDFDTEYTDKKGKVIPLRISCSPLIDNENEKIGKVLIIRDMSSIKKMEHQLERSRRLAALGKMAAGVAHEIRNPLGTLRGFAQFFGQQSDSNEHIKDYSKLMIGEIDRLNQTVSQLLQFSRPRNPQLKQIRISDLLKKAVLLMEADLLEKNIQIKWENHVETSFTADSDLLLQVLMNLLKNSINASHQDGKISLIGTRDQSNILFIVKDNGRGMSIEDRERMFDPFFTTTPGGTGLGLAVSHQLIEQHNGTIEVYTRPGQGTTITIRLPI